MYTFSGRGAFVIKQRLIGGVRGTFLFFYVCMSLISHKSGESLSFWWWWYIKDCTHTHTYWKSNSDKSWLFLKLISVAGKTVFPSLVFFIWFRHTIAAQLGRSMKILHRGFEQHLTLLISTCDGRQQKTVPITPRFCIDYSWKAWFVSL